MAAILDIATKDLDDEYDLNNMTLIQKYALVDKIFNKGNLGRTFLVKL